MKKIYIIVGITNTVQAGLRQFIFLDDNNKWQYDTKEEAEEFFSRIETTKMYMAMKLKLKESIFQIQESYKIE